MPETLYMWFVAFGMVTIISLCSLLGLSIVPLISGQSYKVFITLFTGLAVGSLVGSAIFSLIPQAFDLHLRPSKAHLWKSLSIFGGIYLFYLTERLMRVYFHRETKRQLKAKSSNDSEEHHVEPSQFNQAGDSHAMSQLNSQEIQEDRSPLKEVKKVAGDQFESQHHHHNNTKEILTRALTSKNKFVKREIAPVAWMIIFGDGLHNFIDGLAIGAAFTKSISLGLTQSLAVIFEEFPHELGDFAVLISSGMTVRQALGYNFLSACTCYIGLVVGILLGDLTQSASFIFALAGGMFLYISLVDMMGELKDLLEETKDSPKETLKLFLMQNIGILTGIIILFCLSWINLSI